MLVESDGPKLLIVAALKGEKMPVVLVNPRQVRYFAGETGKLAKTDVLDASVLAQFGEATKFPVRPLCDSAPYVLLDSSFRRSANSKGLPTSN